MRPAKFNVYKGIGAAQIGLIHATINTTNEFETNTGAVIIEAAKSTGKGPDGLPVYNWKEKISFAIAENDICLLFNDITTPLIHDYKGKIKQLKIIPGQDKYAGTFMLQLSEKTDAATPVQITVPFTGGEMKYFQELIKYSCSKILGW